MGIDRIGKGGAPPPTPDTKDAGSLEKSKGVDKPFSVQHADASQPTKAAKATEAAQATAPSSPLARLRAGEIDVNGYMDLKVDEATRGLQGLPRAELDEIKRVLRDQMATDPGLADLTRLATGQIPKPPED